MARALERTNRGYCGLCDWVDGRPQLVMHHFMWDNEIDADGTELGRQEAWEEPKGRAAPLGLQVGGPNTRLPDEYGQA